VRQPDEATQAFEAQRPRLLRLACRMLGSMAEAEDVVQDAWLRWQQVDQRVDAPAAFLTRVVSRLCLDRMKSARARRETYVGAWLPEPLVGNTEDEPEDHLTLTLMLALERLSPLERAAFLLHDVFGTPLQEIAGTLGRDAAAVRQLAVRARKHVQATRPRYSIEQVEADRIAQAFFVASRDGDTQALSTILAENVVLHSDGGGRVLAFRNPIIGAERIIRLYASLRRKLGTRSARLLRSMLIDGLPGYVSFDRGEVLQSTALEIVEGRIAAIYIVRNPDKLRHIARMLEPHNEARLPHQEKD
jgi:RNA polymerase sigma factor (sigma-70 family)